MVVIDTDVLAVEFLFQYDPRYKDNHDLLTNPKEELATTVYNLLEFLGLASFNLPVSQLTKWQDWLCSAYGMALVWPRSSSDIDAQGAVKEVVFDQPFQKIAGGHFHYMDAAIYDLVERTPGSSAFVTWNKRHFVGKGRVPVYTPSDFLESISI